MGADAGGQPVLTPRYDLIHQSGIDVQATLGNMLWKLETIHRSGQGDALVAASGGFEYTMVGVLGTVADLGWLGEYHFDGEGEGNTFRFEDDIFVGIRLALNDVQSSELLMGRHRRPGIKRSVVQYRGEPAYRGQLEARGAGADFQRLPTHGSAILAT